MAAVDALKSILDRLHKEDGVSVSGVVSRNGIPIVCNVPNPSQADTFSTLSATIMGAGEVIFTGVGRGKPEMVMLSSPSGNMVCLPISAKSLLVLMSESSLDDLKAVAERTRQEIREVLSNEQKV
ncbi:MAG: roadblock/LC7 domain-containing protein [Thermoplasmata archaeon]|nr:roadblock/LC7 domain-containing protein [Thermoplasmata archaeon]